MSVRLKLILFFLITLGGSYYYLFDWLEEELNRQYAFLAEDTLADTVNLAAAAIENNLRQGHDLEKSSLFLESYQNRTINALIYGVLKEKPSLGYYVVDLRGKVVQSSESDQIGQDFSNWNDVHLALEGAYGARSTRLVADDPESSQYIIAAPIRSHNKVVGAVSVIKLERQILQTTHTQLRTILLGIAVVFAFVGLLSVLLTVWITKPIARLKDYVTQIADGKRVHPPQFRAPEMKELMNAFENMRLAIDGHSVVEQYTQNLTHEMKSPLTAISGAAELLQESMSDEQRDKFLGNILEESSRAKTILDELLTLSALEGQKYLEQKEKMDWVKIFEELESSLAAPLAAKKLEIVLKGNGETEGNTFLCAQALRNLVENAIQFCHPHTKILVSLNRMDHNFFVSVSNDGPLIPDYALPKVFEKFFSLERPETGRKSSGLGLSFVHQVALLHQGSVSIINKPGPDQGVKAEIRFPT